MTRYMQVCIVVVVLVSSAFAGNLYVDFSNTCRGSNPCFTTIQAAVDASASGDNIVVMPGEYRESVQINHPLKLKAFDLQPMTPIHQERDWSRIITTDPNKAAVTITSTADVIIEGFFLIGGDGAAVYDSRRIVVRDNLIVSAEIGSGNNYGVLLQGDVSDSEVQGNYFRCEATVMPGVAIWGNACPATRSGGNTISQNMGFGICSAAIWVLNSDGNTVANNTIQSGYKHWALSSSGILLWNASENVVLHNDISSVPAEDPRQRLQYGIHVGGNCGESAGNVLQVNNLVETLPANPDLSEGIHLDPPALGTILRNNLISNWTVPLTDLGTSTMIIGNR